MCGNCDISHLATQLLRSVSTACVDQIAGVAGEPFEKFLRQADLHSAQIAVE